MHQDEGFTDCRAARQKPVVAQDHDLAVAEIPHEPRALLEVERDAFVVVVGGPVVELQRPLVERQQALLHRRNRDARHRMRVQDAVDVRARLVNGAVDGEAGLVDPRAEAVAQDVALEVDGHEAARRDLVEAHAVGIDQEDVLALVGGRAGRDVGEDAVVHLEMRDEPVGGCEFDALRRRLGGGAQR